MSKGNIDDFMKQKLEGYKIAPSQDAWSKIEGSIKTKTSARIYWYVGVAASITIILVIAFLGYDLNRENPDNKEVLTEIISDTLSTEKVEPVQGNDFERDTTKGLQKQSSPDKKKEDTSQPKKETKKRPTYTNNRLFADVEKEEDEEKNLDNEVQDSVFIPEIVEEQVADVETKTDVLISADSTLELNIKDELPIENITDNLIADNNLNPPNELPSDESVEPEAEEDKGFGFRKIVEMARDLKNDNKAWSSLREAKNELLTFGRSKDESTE